MGETALKNVGLPLGVYRVSLPEPGRPREDAKAPRQRLAVLPFVNISPDPNDEYFADGLTEELISKLSEINGLKVIARTSVMSYKRTTKKVSEIASELGIGSDYRRQREEGRQQDTDLGPADRRPHRGTPVVVEL